MHFLLSLTHQEYGRVTSFTNIKSQFGGSQSQAEYVPEEYYLPPDTNVSNTLLHDRRANATFVMLARNSDLNDAVRSVREAEDRFNRKYKYPWVFCALHLSCAASTRCLTCYTVNEEPFTDEFKRYINRLQRFWLSVLTCHRRISVLTQAEIHWGLIPKDDWYQPDWIDEEKASAGRKKMEDDQIIYGGQLISTFVIIHGS